MYSVDPEHRHPVAPLASTTFDVTSLRGRRAVHRWERTSVGDVFERLTWSCPVQVAMVGRPGA